MVALPINKTTITIIDIMVAIGVIITITIDTIIVTIIVTIGVIITVCWALYVLL